MYRFSFADFGIGGFAVLGSLLLFPNCSRPFHSCTETRTCKPTPKTDAGAAGAAGSTEDGTEGGTAGVDDSDGHTAGLGPQGGTVSVDNENAGNNGQPEDVAGAAGAAGAEASDPCAIGKSKCSINATCTPKDDGVSCRCKPGYQGDGATCTFPSCKDLPANCGASSNEDCCSTALVTGGTFGMRSQMSSSVSIATFHLDKYEVSVGRFRKFAGAYKSPPTSGAGFHPRIGSSGWQSGWNASLGAAMPFDCSSSESWAWNPSGTNDRLPMNCISWYEAFAFCAWDGGRLPTNAEWEYAASGGAEERRYPWGDEPVLTNLQDETAAYANYYGLGDGSAPATYSAMDILAVGSKPLGHGRYGQEDLAGSVAEWVLDYFGTLPSVCDNCANLMPGSGRLYRGGYYASNASGVSATSDLNGYPEKHNVIFGIRCARDL